MKILIIEHAPGTATFLKNSLEAEICIVETAPTCEHGITLITDNIYDVIILDFHLPDMLGAKISNLIREKRPSIPILVLSFECALEIKIEMLSTCDDYMIKPFAFGELMVRLRALTRRGEILHGDILKAGELMLDLRKQLVTLNNKVVTLRNKEFSLLEYLMKNKDIVLSREAMLEHVWDMHTDPFTNTVDTHIRLLRKKLENKHRIFIHTVPKRGYRFMASH